jgi:hypothetical protein
METEIQVNKDLGDLVAHARREIAYDPGSSKHLSFAVLIILIAAGILVGTLIVLTSGFYLPSESLNRFSPTIGAVVAFINFIIPLFFFLSYRRINHHAKYLEKLAHKIESATFEELSKHYPAGFSEDE